MAGMHALHKILANCARPQRASVTQAGGEKPYLKARLAAEAARA